MSSLYEFDVVGVPRDLYILIHYMEESCSVGEYISRKVKSKLDAVVQVEERCAVGRT